MKKTLCKLFLVINLIFITPAISQEPYPAGESPLERLQIELFQQTIRDFFDIQTLLTLSSTSKTLKAKCDFLVSELAIPYYFWSDPGNLNNIMTTIEERFKNLHSFVIHSPLSATQFSTIFSKFPSSLRQLKVDYARKTFNLPSEHISISSGVTLDHLQKLPKNLETLELSGCDSLHLNPKDLFLPNLKCLKLQNVVVPPKNFCYLSSGLETLQIRFRLHMKLPTITFPNNLKNLDLEIATFTLEQSTSLPTTLQNISLKEFTLPKNFSFNRFVNLETLDLSSSYIYLASLRALPASLTHLNLNGCIGLDFKEVTLPPDLLPSALKYLNMAVVFRSGEFKCLTNLRELALANNFSMKDSDVCNLPLSLEKIYLNHTSINGQCLKHIPSSCKLLGLCGTEILDDILYLVPKNLSVIGLTRSLVTPKGLQLLPDSLTELCYGSRRIAGNPLHEISPKTFCHFTQLKKLHLEHISIPSGRLESCTSLKSLVISLDHFGPEVASPALVMSQLPSSITELEFSNVYFTGNFDKTSLPYLKTLTLKSLRSQSLDLQLIPTSVLYLSFENCDVLTLEKIKKFKESLPGLKKLVIKGESGFTIENLINLRQEKLWPKGTINVQIFVERADERF